MIVTVRLSNYEAKRLDALRGPYTRSGFLRTLLGRTKIDVEVAPESPEV